MDAMDIYIYIHTHMCVYTYIINIYMVVDVYYCEPKHLHVQKQKELSEAEQSAVTEGQPTRSVSVNRLLERTQTSLLSHAACGIMLS